MRRGIVMVENRLSGQSSGLLLRTDYRNLLLLLVPYLIFDLIAPRFVLSTIGCPLLGFSGTSSRTSLDRLFHSKNADFFMAYSPKLIGYFSQSSHKTWCLSAVPDSCHSIFHQHYTSDTHCFLCCLGTKRLIFSVVHLSASWNMSKRAWVHKFGWINTPATRCGHSGN
jgi:hypothetical protein